jgi:hypothetical protein
MVAKRRSIFEFVVEILAYGNPQIFILQNPRLQPVLSGTLPGIFFVIF